MYLFSTQRHVSCTVISLTSREGGSVRATGFPTSHPLVASTQHQLIATVCVFLSACRYPRSRRTAGKPLVPLPAEPGHTDGGAARSTATVHQHAVQLPAAEKATDAITAASDTTKNRSRGKHRRCCPVNALPGIFVGHVTRIWRARRIVSSRIASVK